MKKTFIMAAILTMSSCAFASSVTPITHNRGWYAGIGLNHQAITSAKQNVRILSPTSQYKHTFSMTHNDLGLNFFVGNRLTQHFGTEFGYGYNGNTKYRAHHPIDDKNNAYTPYIKSINNYNLYYDAYFYYTLNPKISSSSLDVFARAGAGFMHTKNQINHFVEGAWLRNTNNLSTFALNWGAGVAYSYHQFGGRVYYSHLAPSRDIENSYYIPDSVNLDFIWSII